MKSAILVLGSIACVCVVVACEQPSAGSESDVPDAAVSANALSDAPDALCAATTYLGHEYWFCRNLRSWSAARTRCQTVGMELARIDTSAENAFVYGNIPIDAWIGGSDTTTEGAWRWSNNNEQFWSGG